MKEDSRIFSQSYQIKMVDDGTSNSNGEGFVKAKNGLQVMGKSIVLYLSY